MSDPVVIVSAVRTPMGGMLGDFASLSASDLGAVALKAAVERAGLKPEQIDEVILGNCLMAGQGQAPARQATLKAGLPKEVGALTITKMCGSGMKAAMLAHDAIVAGSREIMIAGGMESMTHAPYLLPKARQGYRYGHSTMYDHMAMDGLEDAYEHKAMGVYAEQCAAKYGFTREAQDAYALESLKRAQTAIKDGTFAWEIAPVTIKGRNNDTVIEHDEQPPKAKPDKIPTLKSAFIKDGTVTAANASSISDGAAALVLMKASKAQALGLTPLARIAAHAEFSQEPAWFATAPAGAIKILFKKTGWTAADVDLFEINEAFANVTMAAMKDFDLPHSKVNIHGGATALGHPIGASGARIIVTLIGALKKTGGKKGVASLCIGGGEAVAVAIEMM
jgi:acetyl-CoA C-acetyltransferase